MKKTTKCLTLLLITGSCLFAENSVSGKVFFNHTYGLGDEDDHSFNMKRAYMTYANTVNESVSYKVTYDMGNNGAGSAHTAFLKVAMLKWKTNLGNMMIGMQGMNMFKTMENTWGHRFIAKMPMDTYKFSASADVGIGFAKTFGPVSTSALITNGGGYKSAETDTHKKVSLHAVYGESKLNKKDGFNAGASFSTEPYDAESGAVENTNVMSLFAGFAGSGFRGGFEFDTKTNESVSGQIISAYGTFKFTEKLSALARFDMSDPDTDMADDGKQVVIAGVHYVADKGFTIAPTFHMSTPEVGDPENSIVMNFQFAF